MKVFLDTAHLAAIKQYAALGIVDGITTNPSHLSREGGDPKKIINEICAILPDGDISVEVTASKLDDVYKQALLISKIAPNITVKIPCHADYYSVIKRLVDQGIRINVTLLFTLVQGLYMSKLGVRYISPFLGRLEDIDVAGIDLVYDLAQMKEMHGFETEMLAASIRSVRTVHECILAGADVITLPVEIFQKTISHPLTQSGMELFSAEWAKLGVRQFP